MQHSIVTYHSTQTLRSTQKCNLLQSQSNCITTSFSMELFAKTDSHCFQTSTEEADTRAQTLIRLFFPCPWEIFTRTTQERREPSKTKLSSLSAASRWRLLPKYVVIDWFSSYRLCASQTSHKVLLSKNCCCCCCCCIALLLHHNTFPFLGPKNKFNRPGRRFLLRPAER